MSKENKILLLDPFYAGSHKQLSDLLYRHIVGCDRFVLSGKKWHWRARTAALVFSQMIPITAEYRVMFTSSVLNLSELVALRPDLARLKKIVYFHENQLVYPVRKHQDRDFQYGYNQILTCLVADVIVFNSQYNMESFLSSINSFLKLMPDYRPKGLANTFRPKCQVIFFPLEIPEYVKSVDDSSRTDVNLSQIEYSVDKCTTEIFEQEDWDTVAIQTSSQVECPSSKSHADNKQGSSCTLNKNIEEESVFDRTCPPDTDIDRTCPPDTNIDGTCPSDTDIDTKECLATKMLKYDDDSYVKQNYSDDSMYNTLTDHENPTGSLWDGSNNCGIENMNYTPEKNFENCDKSGVLPCLLPPGKGSSMHSFHIVWPHRWEHDKDPETFFKVMFHLHDEGLDFHLSVIGEQYCEVPAIFEEARQKLSAHIRTWGYQEKRSDYYRVLQQADCVVSTALHEFFGVAILEAVYFKCYPLCPNRLVYPEIFPEMYLYNTPNQLYKRLREFCRRPHLARSQNIQVDVDKYMWKTVQPEFENLLCK